MHIRRAEQVNQNRIDCGLLKLSGKMWLSPCLIHIHDGHYTHSTILEVVYIFPINTVV